MRRAVLGLVLVVAGCEQSVAPLVDATLARCVTIAPATVAPGCSEAEHAGELFVPHLVLRDLHGLLTAPQRNPLKVMPDAVLLATFLGDELDVSMDHSLSFVLIDVTAARVAFKKNDDTDARLRDVTLWNPVQIAHVAGIIQTYLMRKSEIVDTVRDLEQRPLPVEQAVGLVAAQWAEPIASERDRADMLLALDAYVAADPRAQREVARRYPALDATLQQLDGQAAREVVVETRERGRARNGSARKRFGSIEAGFGRALVDAGGQ
jgi:hypothetical protein